jgi:hypothetical protein
LKAFGLGAAANRRLLIPGNHDRYGGGRLPFQRPGREFEDELNSKGEYPYAVGFRPASTELDSKALSLIFFVYDSTPPPWRSLRPWNRIARGHVGDAECAKMEQLATEIAQNGQVKTLDGRQMSVDPNRCVRIAVVHHHPLVDPMKPGGLKNKLTLMENNERFQQSCFNAGVQVVLFGHQHEKYTLRLSRSSPRKTPFGKSQDLYLLCCPSAFECTSENGFYVHEFTDSSVQVDRFLWNDSKRAFLRTTPASIPIQLGA